MRRTSIPCFSLGAALVAVSLSAVAAQYDPNLKENYRVDGIGRLLEVGGRDPIPCPTQTDRTAVLLIAGQSNSANHSEANFRTAYPTRAANFFAGKCYPVESPLLGVTGLQGENWTPLVDKLLAAGLFDRVVLVTTGIGGTEIARWRAGGDLNRMLMDVVKATAGQYRITHVLWHQGESDLINKTSTEDYFEGFHSLVGSLRTAGVAAPIFVSVASKCGRPETWAEEDPISTAQRKLPDAAKKIYAGPDTNTLIPPSDRYDSCHFGKSGQETFAQEWLRILRENAARSSR